MRFYALALCALTGCSYFSPTNKVEIVSDDGHSVVVGLYAHPTPAAVEYCKKFNRNALLIRIVGNRYLFRCTVVGEVPGRKRVVR